MDAVEDDRFNICLSSTRMNRSDVERISLDNSRWLVGHCCFTNVRRDGVALNDAIDGGAVSVAAAVLIGVRIIDLPRHARADGEVVVAEVAAQVPFAITRMFTLTAPSSAERGRHAHRLCSQFMVCVAGAIDVVCDDGHEHRSFRLDRGHLGLLVPPMIWNSVIFREGTRCSLCFATAPTKQMTTSTTAPNIWLCGKWYPNEDRCHRRTRPHRLGVDPPIAVALSRRRDRHVR